MAFVYYQAGKKTRGGWTHGVRGLLGKRTLALGSFGTIFFHNANNLKVFF